MAERYIVVLDCGATDATVSAVDTKGRVARSSSTPNAPVQQPGAKEGLLIWDLEEIWGKMCDNAKKVCAEIGKENVAGVIITTFGTDGAPVDRDGNLVYPVISWQCTRTEELIPELEKLMSPEDIYKITGCRVIYFNSLLRLMWLRGYAPGIFDKMDKFLFAPGLLAMKLSGEFSVDPTIASTSMALDLNARDWSDKMLSLAGTDKSIFPRWVEVGEVIGKVTDRAARESGLPSGIPVIAGGHDTQFAYIGAGATGNELVLSSGTREILLANVENSSASAAGFENGMIVECAAEKGFYNPQILMMGSGVIEWVGKSFYSDVAREYLHPAMIEDAQKVAPGSGGVDVVPSFVAGTGHLRKYNTKGTITGLGITTSRAQVYRATLEGLSYQLNEAVEILKKSTGIRPDAIRVAGGGAKNSLWNQIRAEATGLPIIITSQKEATCLGAAIVGFVGAGIYKSLDEARRQINFGEVVFKPSIKGRKEYRKLFKNHMKVPRKLQSFYK